MSSYGIVCQETAKYVTETLQRYDKEECMVWITEKGQGPSRLQDIARVPADLIVLDISTSPGLGNATLRYRLTRPQTRLILLALGKVPGDSEVAAIVQAGVYDVITDLGELENVISQSPADIASAAIWLDPSINTVSSINYQTVERIVERRVAVSQRPVLIAVTGTASGAGTTMTACALAGYLAGKGLKTVLAEAGELTSLGIITEKGLTQQPVLWVPCLDVCIEPMPRRLVKGRQYSYVVADYGLCANERLAQADADLVIAVLPQAQRITRAVHWLREAKQKLPELQELRYVSICSGRDAEKVSDMWKEVYAEILPGVDAEVFTLPLPRDGEEWPPGYKEKNEKLALACRDVLAEVLPDAPGRKGKSWLSFAKRKTT